MRSIVMLSLALAACTGGSRPEGVVGPPDEDVHFMRVVDGFATREACLEATEGEDILFNCTQVLTLCRSGYAEAILTDIVGAGSHQVIGDVVHVTLDGFDGPDQFAFDLVTRSAAELPGENPWVVTPYATLADDCAREPR